MLSMKGQKFLKLPRRYWQAQRAFDYASQQRVVGQEFGQFGKKVGWTLIRRRRLSGINWVLVPVSITRYFEFAFVKASMLPSAQYCLDVSSPALYSLYLANENANVKIHMVNPDINDIETTAVIADVMNLSNIKTENLALHKVLPPTGGYDCIYSISVVEHIAGEYDDRQSIQMLYDLLGKGGRLIVTVPVDRHYWVEYRDVNHYGTQTKRDEKYFFQRFYDQQAIWERLLNPIDCEPTHVCWFGEKVNGRFRNYIQRWLKEGLDCTIEDPREIVDHYQRFDSWHSMPGVGVCGLVIDKQQ